MAPRHGEGGSISGLTAGTAVADDQDFGAQPGDLDPWLQGSDRPNWPLKAAASTRCRSGRPIKASEFLLGYPAKPVSLLHAPAGHLGP